MRMILAAMLVAAPFAAQADTAMAQADTDTQPMLEKSMAECVRTCTSSNSHAFCADVCGCMTGEMSRHWSAQDLETRMTRLEQNPDDPAIKDEMSRLAQYCASRS